MFKHELSDRQCTVFQFGSMQSYAVGKIDQLVTQHAKDISSCTTLKPKL